MSTKSRPCEECGLEPKWKPPSAAAVVSRCHECWLPRQPIDVQIRYAKRRLALVPVELYRKRVPERDWPEGRRWCSGCQSFVRLAYVTGSRCRACASAANHGGMLEKTYVTHGRPFTQQDYDALWSSQLGLCFICRRPSKSRRLAVDHDHRTGEVRGLLCPHPEFGCNATVLAAVEANRDPVAMAKRIVSYLEDPPAGRILS